GLIVDQYARFKDLIFDSLERVLPLIHLSQEARATVIAVLIFAGVCVRTYILVTRRRRAVRFDDFILGIASPFALVSTFGFAAGVFFSTEVRAEILNLKGGALFVATIAVLNLVYVRWLIISRDVRASFLTFLANLVASVLVVIVLLALGGAF